MPTDIRGRVLLILAIIYLGLSTLLPSAPGSLFWFFKAVQGEYATNLELNLRPGIDMVGGTSLLYEIEVPDEGLASQDLAEQVASALKKRVDPQGTKNLVWRPQGSRRLEIQMAMSQASEQAALVRDRYADAEATLQSYNVRPSAVLRAVQAGDAEALDRLAGDSAARANLFDALAERYAAVEAARESGDIAALAEAELAYEELQPAIDATNLDLTRFRALIRAEEFAEPALPQVREDGTVELVAQPIPEGSELQGFINEKAADSATLAAAMNEYVGAYDAFLSVADTIDDAATLKQLLRGSGVLEFFILAGDLQPNEYASARQRLLENGPRPRPGEVVRWLPVAEGQEGEFGLGVEYADRVYVPVYTDVQRSLTQGGDRPEWGLESARAASDQEGQRVVEFVFDAVGARLFGELTGRHEPSGGRFYQLAFTLDGEVISAPNLNSRISKRGQISGGRDGFSEAEVSYLVSTLNAGSLPAKLTDEPIVERTIGPSLGRDNLNRGLAVSIFGVFIVAAFLIGYYYLSGIVATVAILINLLLILASMAALDATFTLPGVAGIILSLGMAVDANVLIFERLREEQQRGLSIRKAIANAYDRAFSAIIDSNVTTFVTAAVLYFFGSEEVKGFGLTLMIGTVVSLFTALYVTKTIFAIFVDKFGVEKLGDIPTTFPKWDRVLNPGIDWMGKVWVLSAASVLVIILGLASFTYYAFGKGQMLDIEFASGTAVQFELTEQADIADVRETVDAESLAEALPAVNVQSVESPGVEPGRTFELVTVNEDADAVRSAVLEAFAGRLNIEAPSRFTGDDAEVAAVYGSRLVPIAPGLTTIGGYDVPEMADFVGGAAVLLEGLDPPLAAEAIERRLEQARLQPDAGNAQQLTSIEAVEVPGTGGTAAVVLAYDADYEFDPDAIDAVGAGGFRDEVAGPLFELTRGAVADPPQLQKVTNFDPQVAGEFRNDAIVAVIISVIVIVAYIWLRFGHLKYGTATVVALLHDTLFTFAAIGFAHLLAETFLGDLLLLEPFRLNLTMVAAVLTVMGFSMNDTVVVFDRIRENREKTGTVNRQVINDSINQTLSRTLLTGGTTLVTIFVMYVFGGAGIHAFTFAMLVGIVTGTYSSIAIASPILLIGGAPVEVDREIPDDVGVQPDTTPEPAGA